MTDLNYKKKDFVSDQEVRWCPGCGDYAILAAVQMAMTKIGKKKEDIAFISGIGCSSRFPYYMDTYGLHSIHGRAPAFATGLKVHNPNLSVWQITGDGDGLSIGGNHLIHVLRRNVNINIILFNNEIYGLTKGQYSPTSQEGLVTKSTPYGSIDHPFNPAELALGAGSTFFARTIDTDPKHMQEVFLAASEHEGTSLIEVFQNCVIFNDKVHEEYTNRSTRDDHTVRLENGKPMIFGKEGNKGIINKQGVLSVGTVGENGVTEADFVIHDPANPSQAHMLANIRTTSGDNMPIPLGVLKASVKPTYEGAFHTQIDAIKEKKGNRTMQQVLEDTETWTVK